MLSSKEKKRGKPWARWLQLGLMLLILGFLAKAAAEFLNGREIWDALHRFHWSFAPLILGSSLLYLACATQRAVVLMAPLSGVPGWAIARGYLGAQPASMVPGGVALRAAIFTRLGVPPACSSAAILNASAMDQLLMILTTCIAALWFAKARKVAVVLLAVLTLLTLLLVVPATRKGIVGLLKKLARLVHWEKHIDQFIESLCELANLRTMLLAATLTLLMFTSAVIEFMFVLHAIGVKVPFWTALLAYTLPSIMGRIFITPGGIGVTEGGMIGLLSTIAHINRNTAAAGSALFRISDSFFQALVGVVIYLLFWRGKGEERWMPKESQHEQATNNEKNPQPKRKLKAASS
jgi:uncharacterized protein (TIRG00374 family)